MKKVLVKFNREGCAMNVLKIIELYYMEKNEQKKRVSEEARVIGNRLLLGYPKLALCSLSIPGWSKFFLPHFPNSLAFRFAPLELWPQPFARTE